MTLWTHKRCFIYRCQGPIWRLLLWLLWWKMTMRYRIKCIQADLWFYITVHHVWHPRIIRITHFHSCHFHDDATGNWYIMGKYSTIMHHHRVKGKNIIICNCEFIKHTPYQGRSIGVHCDHLERKSCYMIPYCEIANLCRFMGYIVIILRENHTI